jgi:hypothetical protein
MVRYVPLCRITPCTLLNTPSRITRFFSGTQHKPSLAERNRHPCPLPPNLPQCLMCLGVVPALLSLLCLCGFIFVLDFKLIGIHGRLKELNYQEYIALVQY